MPQPAQKKDATLAFGDSAWRYALALALSLSPFAVVVRDTYHHDRPLFWTDLVLGAVAYVLVAFRRSAPTQVALATAALSSLSALAAGPAFLAAGSLATHRRFGPIALVFCVNILAANAFIAIAPFPDEERSRALAQLMVLVLLGAVIGWGMYLGSRRELIHSLRSRAVRAESENTLRTTQAKVNERTRIAREMHDVLAHRISQVSMHAGALAFRQDLDEQHLRAGLGQIQEQANRALDELRGVLGVLRDSSGDIADGPQPTLDDLDDLVETARAGGQEIVIDMALLSQAELPEAVGRTVYRIVQEGLTNAAKHAPGQRLTVRISGGPIQGLNVLLRNRVVSTEATPPGSKLGLVGLRERIELHGGRLSERKAFGIFILEGWIPWQS